MFYHGTYSNSQVNALFSAWYRKYRDEYLELTDAYGALSEAEWEELIGSCASTVRMNIFESMYWITDIITITMDDPADYPSAQCAYVLIVTRSTDKSCNTYAVRGFCVGGGDDRLPPFVVIIKAVKARNGTIDYHAIDNQDKEAFYNRNL